MSLGDYFKPDWKHSNIEIRLKSLDRLTRESNQDRAFRIIQTVALEDPHPKVKAAAIHLLGSPERVREVFFKTKTATQKEIFQLNIEDIVLKKISEGVEISKIQHWVDIFVNEEHLVRILKRTNHLDFKKYLLEKISEIDWLLALYFSNNETKVPPDLRKNLIAKLEKYREFETIRTLESCINESSSLLDSQKKSQPSGTQLEEKKQSFNAIKLKWKSNKEKLAFLDLQYLEKSYLSIENKILETFNKK